jgi:hypothetical protein
MGTLISISETRNLDPGMFKEKKKTQNWHFWGLPKVTGLVNKDDSVRTEQFRVRIPKLVLLVTTGSRSTVTISGRLGMSRVKASLETAQGLPFRGPKSSIQLAPRRLVEEVQLSPTQALKASRSSLAGATPAFPRIEDLAPHTGKRKAGGFSCAPLPAVAPLGPRSRPYPGPSHRLLGSAEQHAGDSSEHLPHGALAVATVATLKHSKGNAPRPQLSFRCPEPTPRLKRSGVTALESRQAPRQSPGPIRTISRAFPAHMSTGTSAESVKC